MRTTKLLSSPTTFIALISMTVGMTGCSEPTSPPPAAATKPSTVLARHDHDHSDGDHSHGAHAHGVGPHGGTVADWGGGKYHVEFTVDHDAKEATIYLLGADEKTPAPATVADGKLLLTIREPAFQVDLVAKPLEDETAGAASRYVGGHDSLGIVREFAGTISGAVADTPYAGDFEEHAHEHE